LAQQNKIQNSRYDIRYRALYTIRILKYLRKQGQKDFQKIIARVRCGNEENRNKLWREQEKKLCKISKGHISKGSRNIGAFSNELYRRYEK